MDLKNSNLGVYNGVHASKTQNGTNLFSYITMADFD